MPSPSRTLVVVNPKSANGATGKAWPDLAAAIGECIGPFDDALTGAPGDATRITRKALRAGYDTIVSVGGDGTLNEVVNGFFDERAEKPIRPEAVLAAVSSGTGGDFRRTLAQPRGLPGAVAHLASDRTLAVDVGRLECEALDGTPVRRVFLNIASFGISGQVDREVNRSTKVLGGFASFLIGTLRALVSYRPQTVRMRIDDGEWQELRVMCVAVANGRYFGGGMQVAPLALIDDGFFDVVELGEMRLGALAALAPRLYRGDHLELEGVHLVRGTRVEATSDDEVLIDIDGEMPGRLPAVMEVLPAALKLRVRY